MRVCGAAKAQDLGWWFGFGIRGSLVEVAVVTSGTCARAVVDWDLSGLD